jgi:lipopolysaccharide transport system permease protein
MDDGCLTHLAMPADRRIPLMLLTEFTKSTVELVRTVWRNWRLLRALAKRDVSDEYVRHGLSVAWPVLQALFVMLVYLFVFIWIFPSRVDVPPGSGTNAMVYLLSGLVPWLTLNQVITRSLSSVVENSNVVKQVAFPLELLPLKTLATPFLFGLVSLLILLAYAVYVTRGAVIPVYLWGLPLLLCITLPLFVGLTLLLSTIQVFSRDFKEIVSMFLTAGLFIHPILYLPDHVPEIVRPVIYFSPFSYLLFCWQDIMFFGEITRPFAWIVTAALAAIVFVFGARLFLAAKPHFGDFL